MAALQKDRIKDQMIKTAARLWDVPENEIETSFDPLALLMIEACAAGLEKIGHNITASQARLTDRLAELIIPDIMTGAQPASCIMQANPAEAEATVGMQHAFYTNQYIRKEGTQNGSNQDVFFSPAGKFKLINAKLAYLFCGNKLYGTSERNNRDLLYSGPQSPSQNIWLAIAPAATLKSLEGLNIFFNLRSHADAQTFFYGLSASSATINGQPFEIGRGYYNNGQFELDPGEMLESGYNVTQKLNRVAAGVYQNRFLHCTAGTAAQTGSMPAAWNVLPPDLQKEIGGQNLIYINIQLNRLFSQDLLDGLTCSINAFPAVNRRIHTLESRTNEWVNIIPLPVNGFFTDIDSISGTGGGEYKFRYSAGRQEPGEGEALVRSSGVGQTSSREVREMTEGLTEAIRDQCAYFSEVSNDFILSRLREISQILARLEDHLKASEDTREVLHYVMLRPRQPNDLVTIRYWTSLGNMAHQVKPFSPLMPYGHSITATGQAVIVSAIAGGRNGVSEAGKKVLMRQQLLNRGRVVSADDVKMLARQTFGAALKSVQVAKNVHISAGKSSGFIRTIDVTVALQEGMHTPEETDYLCNELEYLLMENASPGLPFRIRTV